MQAWRSSGALVYLQNKPKHPVSNNRGGTSQGGTCDAWSQHQHRLSTDKGTSVSGREPPLQQHTYTSSACQCAHLFIPVVVCRRAAPFLALTLPVHSITRIQSLCSGSEQQL
jgi:hypothetical protein